MNSKTSLIFKNCTDQLLLEKGTMMLKGKKKVVRHMFLENFDYFFNYFAIFQNLYL